MYYIRAFEKWVEYMSKIHPLSNRHETEPERFLLLGGFFLLGVTLPPPTKTLRIFILWTDQEQVEMWGIRWLDSGQKYDR